MRLLDKILGYGEIKGPEFTKDFSVDDNAQIAHLLQLLDQVTDDSKVKIEKELLNIRSGLSGERNVYFELKNSRLPIVCLHDIRLEHNNHEAQFDFIIIASEFILVLETKKLFGNITIDNEGNFTREYQINGKFYKEGMYSPITQNERHIRLLKEFLVEQKLIKHCPIYSLIVIANDKTIVNKKFAKAEVKNLIIKHDQLIERLHQYISENNLVKLRHNYMREIAETIINNNSPIEYDYIKKLSLEIKAEENSAIEISTETPILADESSKEDEEEGKNVQTRLHHQLKKYRSNKSKEMNIKAYYVFNNNELDQIISLLPKTKEQFLRIQGFGEKKYEQYGEDIIGIIKEHLEKVEGALKAFRLESAKMNGLKPYEIFNNQQLDQIIEILPKNKEQLIQVRYYSRQQIDAYGEQIVSIINESL